MQISGEYRDGGYQEYTSHVKCESCGSISEVVTESLSLSEVEKMAEEAWNTRVERTCHNMSDFQDCDCFICSECGEAFETARLEYDDDLFYSLNDAVHEDYYDRCDCDLNYCPNCGAKVVE